MENIKELFVKWKIAFLLLRRWLEKLLFAFCCSPPLYDRLLRLFQLFMSTYVHENNVNKIL